MLERQVALIARTAKKNIDTANYELKRLSTISASFDLISISSSDYISQPEQTCVLANDAGVSYQGPML